MSSDTEEELREQIDVLTTQLIDAERKIMILEEENRNLNEKFRRIREYLTSPDVD